MIASNASINFGSYTIKPDEKDRTPPIEKRIACAREHVAGMSCMHGKEINFELP